MIRETGNARIDLIMQSYVPANERQWYPWIWPETDWYRKAGKKEINDFVEHVKYLAKTDLFFFADQIMRNPNDLPLCIGLHDEICHLLQFGGDIGILIPRNHLKSTIVSGAFPLWLLGNNPNLRIMICSAVKELSESLVSYIRDNIAANKRLKQVFPNLQPAIHEQGLTKKKIWNKNAILFEREAIKKEPSILVMGLDNQPKTGFHCDLMIYDDIVTHENANSPENMKKAKENYEHSTNLMDRDSRKVYAGTRYNDADTYGDLIKKNEVPFYVRSAVENGKYIWPAPSNIRYVEKKRLELTPYIFACQYQNDPIVKGDAEFEQEWVKRWTYDLLRVWMNRPTATDEDVFWEWLKTLDLHQGCDPNRTDKKRSDYGVNMIVGVNAKGHRFGLYVRRERMKTPDLVEEFINTYEKWKPKTAYMETYGGDIHVYNDVKAEMKKRNLPYFKIKEYEKNMRMSGDDRIRKLQFPMQQGMWYFGPGPEWDTIIHEELLRFPYGAHDDGITTMAYIDDQQVKPRKESKREEFSDGWQSRVIPHGNYCGGERDWLLQ